MKRRKLHIGNVKQSVKRSKAKQDFVAHFRRWRINHLKNRCKEEYDHFDLVCSPASKFLCLAR
ncbi:hypothetical protein T4E_502 [Trichinella pseudospiralis]|uniref:Uncharacterized protein n=1 Tax=Trichinella pseudospiralis TaxID=6337 RepID=A0A0V0YBY3_TRIPS|nr:hypothetical protein T4E_502 [Trichinella pseudospiralis]